MGKHPFSGGRGRRNVDRGPRKNDRIRVPEIRVIAPDGRNLGIMQTRDALDLAKQAGLDLLEISPSARPPVCRILDYGKYKYEQSKKDKDKDHHQQKLKEVKFRVRVDQHDYMTKIRRAEVFLSKGSKVKLTLMFRGREMEHTNLGFVVIRRAIEDLNHIAHPDNEPRLAGRNITMTVSPLPANKRRLKWNTADDVEAAPEDDSDPDDSDSDSDEN